MFYSWLINPCPSLLVLLFPSLCVLRRSSCWPSERMSKSAVRLQGLLSLWRVIVFPKWLAAVVFLFFSSTFSPLFILSFLILSQHPRFYSSNPSACLSSCCTSCVCTLNIGGARAALSLTSRFTQKHKGGIKPHVKFPEAFAEQLDSLECTFVDECVYWSFYVFLLSRQVILKREGCDH